MLVDPWFGADEVALSNLVSFSFENAFQVVQTVFLNFWKFSSPDWRVFGP